MTHLDAFERLAARPPLRAGDAWLALAMVTLPWACVIGAVALFYSCAGAL